MLVERRVREERRRAPQLHGDGDHVAGERPEVTAGWPALERALDRVSNLQETGAFAGVDLIASPTTPTVAFRAGSRTADPLSMYVCDICTIPANLAGLPAISIPCGLSDGLPVGFQLIGPAFSENRILQTAHALEGAIGFDGTPAFRDSRAGAPGDAGASPAGEVRQ